MVTRRPGKGLLVARVLCISNRPKIVHVWQEKVPRYRGALRARKITKSMAWVLHAYAMAAATVSSCPNSFLQNPEKGPLGAECELTSSTAPAGDATLCYAQIDLHTYREKETLPEAIIQTIRAKFEALRRVGTQPLIRYVICHIISL